MVFVFYVEQQPQGDFLGCAAPPGLGQEVKPELVGGVLAAKRAKAEVRIGEEEKLEDL